jgi:hypothetical protein
MDRYTKGFVVAALAYFFVAAVLGIWIGSADAAPWARFAHVHFNLLGFMSMMIYGVGTSSFPASTGAPFAGRRGCPSIFTRRTSG